MRIITEIPGQTDATQWYRGAGPLSYLSKTYSRIQIRYAKEIDWGTLKSADILFLLRPTTTHQAATIQRAKDLGVKVWVDYDDYLLDIPKDNPSAIYYNNTNAKENVKLCLAMADKVTVSTGHLKSLFKEFNKNIDVVSNSLDPNLLRHKPKKDALKNIILWRGTSTHQRDLLEYADQIVSVARANPGLRFIFLGYNPWFITEKIGDQAKVFPPVDLFQFHQAMCSIRPLITMVPLNDSDFNRSKSNIAALEGSLAGSAILAPSWEEWKLPGVFNYTPESFATCLHSMLAKETLIDEASATWLCISDRFMLDNANRIRLSIIEELS